MTPIPRAHPVFVQSLYNPRRRFHFSNQSEGGKINGIKIVSIVKLTVGVDKTLIIVLKISIIRISNQGL